MANDRVLYTDSYHLKADANPLKDINEIRPEGVSEHLDKMNAAKDADDFTYLVSSNPGYKGSLPTRRYHLPLGTTRKQSLFYLEHLCLQ